MTPVQFRLDESYVKDLDLRAKARGLTRAQYLRAIVTDGISDETRDAVVAKLDDLRHAVEVLKHKLATATAGILMDANNLKKELGKQYLSKDEVNAWVTDKIMG